MTCLFNFTDVCLIFWFNIGHNWGKTAYVDLMFIVVDKLLLLKQFLKD